MATPTELEFLRLPFAETRETSREAGNDAAASAANPHLSIRPEDILAIGNQAVEPLWRWPVALASALALHAGIVLLFAVGSSRPAPPPETIEVAILGESEAAPDQPADPAALPDKAAPKDADAAPDVPGAPVAAQPKTEPEPVETPPDPDAASPPAPNPTPQTEEAQQTPAPAPETLAAESPPNERASPGPAGEAASAPIPTPTAELPEASAAEANPVSPAPEPPQPAPAAKPPSTPEKANAAGPTKPARQVVDARHKPAEKPPKSISPERKPNPSATAQGSDNLPVRQAAKLGTAQGNSATSQISRASYGALLLAEIARHKVYPEAAREAGASGSVGVALTVGPSGRIVSHAIAQSSGNPAIDGEVHAMMAAVQAPPPPGGIFQARVLIRFGLQ